VRTLLQSGNAVFSTTTRSAATVEKQVEKAIEAELGLSLRVLVRSAAQLRKVLDTDPLGDRATDHARYMVVFLEKALTASALSDLDPESFAPEEFAHKGRELYLWLPKGSHDSKLARAMSDKRLGGTSTTRNWNTVRKLAEMADA
jgi:uncharacterized protein (DUF1697 family)